MKLRHALVLAPILALLLFPGCNQAGSNSKPAKVWLTSDLTNYAKVVWNPTNPIPLTPDAAVRAALNDLRESYGTNFHWQVSSIKLEGDRTYPSFPWMYYVECISGQEGSSNFKWETVRVLLSANKRAAFVSNPRIFLLSPSVNNRSSSYHPTERPFRFSTTRFMLVKVIRS
jgi:hypothetical protein